MELHSPVWTRSKGFGEGKFALPVFWDAAEDATMGLRVTIEA